VLQAVVFGGSAGVFLHMATDFLPRCEVGGDIHEALGREKTDRALLNRLRPHAAVSTAVGVLAVVLAWLALGGWR
jgi:ZIP family zinc transporter